MSTPRFVNDILCLTTPSSTKVSWSAPTTRTGQIMNVDSYLITYQCGDDETVGFCHPAMENVPSQFVLANFYPKTYTLFTIVAEYQGMIGPKVSIGIFTGNCHIRIHKYIEICVVLFSPSLVSVYLILIFLFGSSLSLYKH